MKEIKLELSYPIEYAFEGQTLEADHLMMVSPSAASIKFTSQIKNLFFDAISKNRNEIESKEPLKKDSSDQSDITPVMVEYILSTCNSGSVDKLHQCLKDLFCSGAIKLPTGQRINIVQLDKLSLEDYEKLIGEYVVNFIIGSLLKRMSQK